MKLIIKLSYIFKLLCNTIESLYYKSIDCLSVKIMGKKRNMTTSKNNIKKYKKIVDFDRKKK